MFAPITIGFVGRIVTVIVVEILRLESLLAPFHKLFTVLFPDGRIDQD